MEGYKINKPRFVKRPDECRHVDGTEYVEYSERQTKTRTGAELRHIRSVKPKAFTTQDGPVERNPVFVYKIYREKRPNSMLTVEAPFYLSINYSNNSDKFWFKTSAVRLNKLNLLLRTMANKAISFKTRREAMVHKPQRKKKEYTKTERQQRSPHSHCAVFRSSSYAKGKQLQFCF